MASEQLSRRENTTNERDIRVEKDRVPKMTTHFEHLSVQGNEPPLGSIDALQGGEINKDHAGKAIGDVGGRGKARETHGLGSHFEPIADKVKGQNITDHRTTAPNVVGDKRSEDATKGREAFGGARDVGKFQMQTEGGKSLGGGENLDRGNMNREELERRTRVVEGRTTPDIKGSSILGLGKGGVVAEKGRLGAQTTGEGEDKLRGRFGARDEEKVRGRVGAEAIGEEKVRGRRVDAPEREGAIWGKGGVQKERPEREGVVAEKGRLGAQTRGEGEDNLRGRVGVGAAENEGAMLGKSGVQKERADAEREIEENKNFTLEEISKYRNQAQESAMNVLSAAQERYEKAKQAKNETLSSTTQTAQQKASQATNETLSSTTQTAQQKASQAKDVTLEKGQQGYEATKDTVSSAAKTAAEYTTPAVEKAKCATGTTVSYVGEKAAQAKDVTLETGKTAVEIAGKVAADLKDKATVAGWTAANYSTELTVEGTKAAANVVEGVAGYTGHKAAELAAKSVDVVKNLAASAGETAKEFTSRKKEESWRDYEAKRATQPQEGEARPTEGIGETVSNYAQKVMPSGESNQGGQAQGNYGQKKMQRGQAQGSNTNQEGRGSNVISAIGETMGNVGEKVKRPFENITSDGEGKRVVAGEIQGNKGNEGMTTNIGEKLSDAAQTMKKPLQNITEGGKEVMGAVTETVGNIGSNIIKPAEKVQEQRGGQEGQSGGGVLDAIGETIVEIAQTTKVIVVGEDDKESKQKIGFTNRAKHEHDQPPRNV